MGTRAVVHAEDWSAAHLNQGHGSSQGPDAIGAQAPGGRGTCAPQRSCCQRIAIAHAPSIVFAPQHEFPPRLGMQPPARPLDAWVTGRSQLCASLTAAGQGSESWR